MCVCVCVCGFFFVDNSYKMVRTESSKEENRQQTSRQNHATRPRNTPSRPTTLLSGIQRCHPGHGSRPSSAPQLKEDDQRATTERVCVVEDKRKKRQRTRVEEGEGEKKEGNRKRRRKEERREKEKDKERRVMSVCVCFFLRGLML